MRVAAVAFVLIVGAAVVLAFANTLNSWVLGGLLGGLAAILLCIPISLAIFTFLTRRHDSHRRAATQGLEMTEEAAFADEVYEDDEKTPVVLAAEEQFLDPRVQYPSTNRRAPISGYLPLPPVEQDFDPDEDIDGALLARRDPRNYPRQPRYPARSQTPEGSASLSSPPAPGATRRPATRSLAQHQSAALRKARQEAQQQQQVRRRGASDSLARRAQGGQSAASRRPRTSHSLRQPERPADFYQPENEYDTRQSRQQPSRTDWHDDDDFSDGYTTEELQEPSRQYPRHPAAYPRRPRNLPQRAAERWTGELNADDEQEEETYARRSRRDPERLSGNLRNPLVRRAPYLYDDDPLNEEFARQLDNDRPITRRSSRHEQYRDDEED